jgi:parvulin-like peptidyl-prolyl isomerase
MMRRFVLILLPSLLLLPVRSRAEIVERVVAKVNGQIITLSEFQSRQVAAAQAARIDPAQIGSFLRQNNAHILQDAIDELLILQKAQDAGIQAPAQWIDEAIDTIKKENHLTTEELFQAALAREGLTYDELRQNIERSIIRRIVMQRDIQPKIEASESELRAEYEKRRDKEFTKPATVTLEEILVKEDMGGLDLARQLAQRARAGEDFKELARTYSMAPTRANGGEVGQIAQGDLNPDLEKIAFSLPVGAVSDPLPVEGGYRIIKVVAKTSGSVVPFDAAKGKLHDQVMAERFDKEYEAYMEDLRKTAVVNLYVREVPLQLNGSLTDNSLLESLAPGPEPGLPASGTQGETPAAPSTPAAAPPAAADEEITTTPQAAPQHVAPAPPPTTPEKPKETPPPPGR